MKMYSAEFDEEQWVLLSNDLVLGNGVAILQGASKKRVDGPLGSGVAVKGAVIVGRSIQNSANELKIMLDGDIEKSYALDGELQVGAHIRTKSGAFIDGRCVLHGPLTYKGVEISKEGGVHSSGSAFVCDGSRRQDGKYYQEVCIEALVKK